MIGSLLTMVGWVLKLVFWLAGATTLVSGLVAWVDRLNQPDPEDERLAPNLAGFVAVLWEWGCTFVTYLALAAGLRNPDQEVPRTDADPILLVHGYGMNRGVWWLFRRRLLARGIGPVFTINLPAYWPGVQDLSHLLARRIEDVSARCGGRRVVVVGHSMGGLVTRAALAASPELPVARLVTLGSPHAGTRTAVLGIGDQAQDMVPRSKTIAKLAEADLPVPVTCVASRFDNLVVPWHSALLDGADELHVVEYLGHNALLLSRDVFELVVPALRASGTEPS